jgi:hypothetical protein
MMLEATRKRLKTVSEYGLKGYIKGDDRKGNDRALLKAIGKAQKKEAYRSRDIGPGMRALGGS